MSPVRPRVKVVGQRLDPAHWRVRDFLTRTAQPHEWIEARTPEADALLAERGLPASAIPAVVEHDGTVHTQVTVASLVHAWQHDALPKHSSYDVAIIGGGPAGLAAAVYSASDGLNTIVLERDVPGGQASHTSMIENFFGFPEGIGGAELARKAGRQAEKFGAEIMVLRGAIGSRLNDPGEPVDLEVDGGLELEASVVLAATGMDWRRLDLPRLNDLVGRGVYYGAGRSEAAQCDDDPVVVVGAGNSAGQAVLNLAGAGARVTMLVRGERLGKTMSAYLVRRIEHSPLVDVRLDTELTAVHSDGDRLIAIGFDGVDWHPAAALFICIGGVPHTDWCEREGVSLDPGGYILTGADLEGRPAGWTLDRDPLPLETSRAGRVAGRGRRHGSTHPRGAAGGGGAGAGGEFFQRLNELGVAT